MNIPENNYFLVSTIKVLNDPSNVFGPLRTCLHFVTSGDGPYRIKTSRRCRSCLNRQTHHNKLPDDTTAGKLKHSPCARCLVANKQVCEAGERRGRVRAPISGVVRGLGARGRKTTLGLARTRQATVPQAVGRQVPETGQDDSGVCLRAPVVIVGCVLLSLVIRIMCRWVPTCVHHSHTPGACGVCRSPYRFDRQ